MESSAIAQNALLLFAGLAAGIVNTFAGGGSAFTLGAMALMGVPLPVANGTNRVGILLQSFIGTVSFQRGGLSDWRKDAPYLLPTLLGSIAGAWTASASRPQTLQYAVGTIMLGLLFLLLFDPKKRLSPEGRNLKPNYWREASLFLAFGFYGGYVQIGLGMIMIAGLAALSGWSLARANGAKLLVTFALTVPALSIFVYKAQVDWQTALWLTVGQSAGSWLAARMAVRNTDKLGHWIKSLLILMVSLTILKVFGIIEWLWNVIR